MLVEKLTDGHLADFITQRKKGLLSLVTFTPPSTSLTIIEPLLKDSNR